MSHQGMADAFARVEAKYRDQVICATWGHLAAKKDKTYEGRIVYAVGCYGNDDMNPTALVSDFKGLDNSPWEFDAVDEFLHHKDTPKESGCVYEFVGTMCNYECRGTIRKLYDAHAIQVGAVQRSGVYNPEYAAVFELKRKVCSKLRRMLRPLLWECGYFKPNSDKGEKIFMFDAVGLRKSYKLSKAIDESVKEIEGFYANGLFDAWGGGALCTAFETLPLEDLIRLDNFITTRLPEFKAARQKMKAKAKAKEKHA
jgi:hypothetical protein